ncbi:MAG: hypothetical protein KatS3mg110_1575 [Pirellulaceae bacterium]|nr:MAG: hypothetical protein KatS3mg110_1575 [Pirellulaceae bacterium]
MHPWAGWDHWLAMFTVGWWAYRMGGRARLWLPGCFLAGMMLGCFAGNQQLIGVFSSAFWEGLVALTILLLGGLLWLDRPISFRTASLLALAAGFTHGHVHGVEAIGLYGVEFTCGVLAATAALHGLGLVVGYCLGQRRSAAQLARCYGMSVGLTGVFFLLLAMW